MRYVFWFWLVPMGLLWGWYALSYHDISFGLTFLSRSTHDLVFAIYGHILGLEKDVVVNLLIKACIVDTLLIMAIVAFRKRRRIRAWWVDRKATQEPSETAPAAPASLPAQLPAAE